MQAVHGNLDCSVGSIDRPDSNDQTDISVKVKDSTGMKRTIQKRDMQVEQGDLYGCDNPNERKVNKDQTDTLVKVLYSTT